MDKRRQQAHLYLIQELLRCPLGSQQAIYDDNRDLLDANLVQMMGQMAEALAERGDRSTADCLINFAREIAEELGLSSQISTASPVSDFTDQLSFLLRVLQVTKESQGNFEVLYPLLQENLNLLDENFIRTLESFAISAFSASEQKGVYDLATRILIFSSLIQEFPFGEQLINVEIALAGYKIVAPVFVQKTFRYQWAMIKMGLGIAYQRRVRGEKAENIERAIEACKQALSVFDFRYSTKLWAATQTQLGNAYLFRINGEKSANIEQAIEVLQQVLSILKREEFPDESVATQWAVTQNALGIAYQIRVKGEKAENIERAIEALKETSSNCDRDLYPDLWIKCQNNLGSAYGERIKGEKAENIEQAIKAHQQALSVSDCESFAYEWAGTQMNLGSAYAERIRGNKARNIKQAIEAFEKALLVFRREEFPHEWATTQGSLGYAYFDSIGSDKAENIERAVEAFQQALSVLTREAFPYDNVKALSNLALAYQTSNQLQLAYDTLEAAVETVELLRDEVRSGNDIKQKLAEKWILVYFRMVTVCLEMNRYTEAIEYVERSKTRNLIELILSRDSQNFFPPDVAHRLEQIRDEIAIGQNKIQNQEADDTATLAQHLMQLRQQRNELQNKYLPIGSGFMANQFRSILDDQSAIIEWLITSDKILAFIIQPCPLEGQKISVWQFKSDRLQTLDNWANAYIRDYRLKKDDWRDQLVSRLEELAKILYLDELIEQLPRECQRLIIIPHRFLHLFPFHALPISNNGKKVNLLDRFPNGVSYAPSCQLLLQAQQRRRLNFTHLFAIQNPTNDLPYADLEVQTITDFFNPVNILKHETATLTAISQANLNEIHCAHFSCHGYFNQSNARKSALILADAPLTTAPTNPDTERYLNVREDKTHDLNKCLTLEAIISLNLAQCRLVTLSACETGLIDYSNTSDEYIGLPSGFLIAGSPSVVSSLWRVDDTASAFLMIKFYQNLKSGSTVAIALNQAQTWLRDATTAELQAWANHLKLEEKLKQQIEQTLGWLDSDEQPFQEPYHWAAFCAVGQ
ncbi:MAG: CHAT domain-containing protein [Synechococcales cyanobacterium K44_A2020_017]|nr:CHAT domain-containing protein [Synechococcales cyanobacterium K32_A2020_035]MBF2096177.1 CHAT domain-containing protein [Synechococcales cyanobacterium K44_A2020_017]